MKQPGWKVGLVILGFIVALSLLAAKVDSQETEVYYVPEADLAFIREAILPTCVDFVCIQEDFFPFVYANGTIASDAAIYWPRVCPVDVQANCGTILSLTTSVTNEDLNDGTLPVPESIAGWCKPDCLTVEYFPLTNPIGSRIATSESDIPFAMDIPADVLLLIWREGMLEQHYGPEEGVVLTPYSAWWHVNIVG